MARILPANTSPSAPERVIVLDVLRGVAILGILVMNIQSFGRISSEYLNPMALGPLPLADWIAWVVVHVLADEKFISMLTLLFGAGIVLMASGSRHPADTFEQRFRRRMGWLFLIGLAHGLILWPGDILAAYAVCGLVAMHFRDHPPMTLLAFGVALLGGLTALWLVLSAILIFLVPEHWLQTLNERYWQPGADVVSDELNRMSLHWLAATGERATGALTAQLWMFFSERLWQMLAMMFIGMALLRLGFLHGTWSLAGYRRVVLIGLGAGIPLVLAGLWFNTAVEWDLRYSMFLGRIANLWGSVAIALAWVALVILLAHPDGRRRILPGVIRALEAVGRLALTNYIGQSILAAMIFYGIGLGLFSQFGHLELLGIVLAIWVFQITFSLLWQRYIGPGPIETLWRRLAS
ncbi:MULTISPECIES: DUF418 domain-containing protein [unclassified Thioalkalivibrio]|uniref:DUF418 domain-containing protein n=1 Tax=unclassified Thioalkalivibrio TaxID=2621013 RepID=UPI0001959C1A|nr:MULTISPECIES: DUF418 domain-containing protein [unclassified Thioalkalivibrio]